MYIFLSVRSRAKNESRKFVNTCGLLLVIYASVLLYLALMGRNTEIRSVFNTPFWSYHRVLTEYNTFDILSLIFENILVFVPLGILFPEALNIRGKRSVVPLTVGAGALLSFVIELGQYTYAIGCTEFDDFFNNVLGCAVGCGIYCFAGKISSDEAGLRIEKSAWKSLLPATLTACGAVAIILYREIILY